MTSLFTLKLGILLRRGNLKLELHRNRMLRLKAVFMMGIRLLLPVLSKSARSHFFKRFLENNVKLLIRALNLVKTYGEGESKTVALDNVSMDVGEGEFVAIIGASGSGKSTLMNILGCLDKPTSGKYFFEDKLVSELSADSLAGIRNKKIGFIFQSFNLLARTSALKNVELPLLYGNVTGSDMTKRAVNLLTKVNLSSKLHSKPSQLSGGEQQRVAIARALVNDPSIIFADEPTGNLDSRTSFEIMKLFSQLNSEGRTIVMITHEMDVARFAARIIRIHDGKILEDKKNKPVRAAFEKKKS